MSTWILIVFLKSGPVVVPGFNSEAQCTAAAAQTIAAARYELKNYFVCLKQEK